MSRQLSRQVTTTASRSQYLHYSLGHSGSYGFVHPEKRTLNYGWLPPEIYFCQGRHVQAALGLLLTHACLDTSDRTLQLCLDSKAPEFSRHSMLLNSKFRKNEMDRGGENKSAAIRLAHIAESVSRMFDLESPCDVDRSVRS